MNRQLAKRCVPSRPGPQVPRSRRTACREDPERSRVLPSSPPQSLRASPPRHLITPLLSLIRGRRCRRSARPRRASFADAVPLSSPTPEPLMRFRSTYGSDLSANKQRARIASLSPRFIGRVFTFHDCHPRAPGPGRAAAR
ncbi:hypothetical protein EVAR_27264_1 [Eumeta japonica]|uniref:Uncharacterized protein n=1 Tax=Eumeta variegata TaxID=151549 RepID=A0A4C1W2E8_EUMVA|nr:hypothetical protein EVAR_27264_1 [Eumeta japonica]